MNATDEHEFCLLGLSLVAAQRIEFLLYGIVAHATHTPAGKKEKRFRDLTPEKFLSGPVEELKATLGQLIEAFGDTLMIKSDELVAYYKDRNLIAHDYTRTFRLVPKEKKGQGIAFLQSFLERSLYWETVLKGLLFTLTRSAAIKEGRANEFELTQNKIDDIGVFYKEAEKFLLKKSTTP